MRRIGILTGGGDCPGLNAVVRAVTKRAIIGYGSEVVGIEDGFQGAMERRCRPLTLPSVRDLLARGGTILGSSNRSNPFAYPRRLKAGGEVAEDLSERCLKNLIALELDALIAVGGDGTMKIAAQLGALGLPVVGVPKTIDNDLPATDYTFGFDTAVEIATQALDRLHTTAESHERVMVCEVMGRYAGWIALTAGLASGADVILVPEIPYQLERVVEAIRRRSDGGVTYSIVVVAEGARPYGGALAVAEKGSPAVAERLGGAAERVAHGLAGKIDHEVRVTVLGHIQRGGTPTAYDRILATRFGVAAVDLCATGQFGRVVNLRGTQIGSVPIAEACQKIKLVDPNGQLVHAARATGVELGA